MRHAREEEVVEQEADRIPGLAILDGKDSPLEKYRYLSNLRYSNVNLFYRLLANNVKVSMETIPGRRVGS